MLVCSWSSLLMIMMGPRGREEVDMPAPGQTRELDEGLSMEDEGCPNHPTVELPCVVCDPDPDDVVEDQRNRDLRETVVFQQRD
jgi:hypothetical protein